MKNVHNNRPRASPPGKLKKQNASNGRKTHTPAKPDKNETQLGAVSRLRTPYLAYFTSTLPKCQGRKRYKLYDLPRIPPGKASCASRNIKMSRVSEKTQILPAVNFPSAEGSRVENFAIWGDCVNQAGFPARGAFETNV